MVRALWFVIGCLCVVVGGIGIIVPGLPTVGFFVFAAAAFSRSSPRFEQWILDLPTIGQHVQDYRDGLGMRKKLKIRASVMLVLSVSLSAFLVIEPVPVKIIVLISGLVGLWFIWVRTPTRPDEIEVTALSQNP